MHRPCVNRETRPQWKIERVCRKGAAHNIRTAKALSAEMNEEANVDIAGKAGGMADKKNS